MDTGLRRYDAAIGESVVPLAKPPPSR